MLDSASITAFASRVTRSMRSLSTRRRGRRQLPRCARHQGADRNPKVRRGRKSSHRLLGLRQSRPSRVGRLRA